ncbi:MAG: hypothetical protein WD712_00440 [Candidatus Spechtbacterales bacterium]
MKKFIVLFLFVLSYVFVFSYVYAQEPAVVIISPTEGQQFAEEEEITVSIQVEDFVFVNFKDYREPFPGNDNAGHAHLWVVPVETETSALNHDDARQLAGTTPVKITAPQKGGEYKMVVELTQNHHAPYDPPAVAQADFSVKKPFSSSAYFVYGGLALFVVLIMLAFIFAKRRFK